MRSMNLSLLLLALAACNGTTADDTDTGSDSGTDTASDTGTDTAAPLAIIGTWTDDYASTHTITEADWTMASELGTSIFAISQYDNTAMFVIAQNDSANAYNADLWSRMDWTHDADGVLNFCQSTYDAADEATALAATPADATDLSAGCGGFAWTVMTAQ